MNKNYDRIQQICTEVLRKYIGVVAPFVVSDAVKKMQINSNLEESLMVALLLQGIANELPVHLPHFQIMAEIQNRLTN